MIVSVLHLPSCRAPKASACQFVGPLKSRLTGTDPERIKEMRKRFRRTNKQGNSLCSIYLKEYILGTNTI